ncbi:hypothetical protein CDO52_12750 [Nocardiopsis gilva YIM 90087]|uniref:Uncharacterized protein n=1 Tax=Nocardiopsis gilva YIM 90087 TaxID=1235441 RepID=A0A223S606_9ACTN|nr:hypothetical protein [Nocardiopsis gilva]ASU83540.1 hypothetical protein CDO52_12750 [Nocardiopsis gilva YIM 90087]
MTEIALRADLPDRMEYARTLASSGLLPKAYRGQPANVLFAVEYGRALGLEPITAINSVHVIEGKPSASSGLISALVRRAGHRLRIRVHRDEGLEAVAQIIRADDPDFTFESRWDLARAQRAGVATKQVWKSYPEAMLKARAITEVAREACEEALLGVGYTPEELGAEVDPDGNVVSVPDAQHRAGATIAEAVAETTQATTEQSEPQVDPDRMRYMGGLMRHLGMGSADALPFVTEVVGREVANRSEMTAEEVEQVISALEKRAEERHEQDSGEERAPAKRFHGTDDDFEPEDEPVDAEVIEPLPEGRGSFACDECGKALPAPPGTMVVHPDVRLLCDECGDQS